MYAVKGGWIGQTFALATCNDSGGRKARIRRSKEERKAMVESFIKTYQMSNDGKFPSLNLTHKEVGGSFYTVREIIRDVIQENRVLGPAKFNSDNQKFNGNTRECPSGSPGMESQDYLFQLENENIALSDQHASAIVEMNMNGNEQYAKHESVDAGEFVGNTAIEESDEVIYVDAGELGITEKHEDFDAEQLVYGIKVEECDEKVSTESSVNESSGVQQESELEVTGSLENANLEGLDADQLVFGKECDEVLHTESSVSESFVVEQEAELEVIGYSENANLKNKLNLEDARQLVNCSTVEEYAEVVSTESSVNDSVVVEQVAELEVTGCSENANLKVKLNSNEEKTKYVNGSQVEESGKIKSVDSSLIQSHEAGRNSGSVEEKTTKLSPTENIAVETFPLRSVTSYTVDTASVNGSLSVVQREVNDPQASSSNGKPAMVHETASKNASDLMEVRESSRSGEASDIGTHDHNKPITASNDKSALLKTADGSEEIRGAKVTDDSVFPNSYEVKFTNYSMELEAEKSVTLGSTNEKPRENQALKESKPTLDRINLGSWEGASKKSNPLFIFLKSLVSAFVKFMSD